MALHLHRAEDTGALAAGLGALLSEPLPDPLATELVLVSARGMERWLSQRLSHVLGPSRAAGDGVCAGIEFRSPASLLAEITGISDADPWHPNAMVWPLLEVLDGLGSGHSWAETLAVHLGYTEAGGPEETELRRGRRYAVARRLAGLFDSYAKARPAMLADWSAGGEGDGAGGRLDEDLRWQPPLWRAVAERIDTDTPPIRYVKTIARLQDSPADLPQRLSLFGHTRLPAADIELLGALASHHDLHLWLPHPSDPLWRALSDLPGQVPRSTDLSRLRADHPLLQTLGRDLRELQRGLPAAQTDQFHPRADFPDTLLGWLQSDISANQRPPVGQRSHQRTDRSVQVHRCHGAARQIDVLRDILLGLLDDDPTLEPRDILVMCPDIDAYAPLITAAFGAGEQTDHTHPAQGLRVRLADRALTQSNPLLGVLAELLAIADGRATASAVLSLAHSAPVRCRFAFGDDDLVAITEWVGAAGVRWGFDAAHRTSYQLAQYPQNTWQFGIDRLLTGAAMSDDSQAWLDTALPLDDVDSGRIELAGRLAEYVQRLRTVVDRLTGTWPLHHWVEVLREATGLLTRVGPDDLWQQGQLDRELLKVLVHAGSRSGIPLRLADVRALLARQLAGRPTRANFRTGTLTVCTMVPMRSVPHRVVCLIGLDDGVFPRTNIADGDDALARRPLTGERDIRSEDRQLLLDAVCSATDTLVITYTGTDEHSGEHRPPAVPVQELLDALEQTAAGTSADSIGKCIVVDHPLQPFDARTVAPDGLVPQESFTFDPAALRGARAMIGERTPKPPLVCGPLAESPCTDVELIDLLKFFENPVRGFFQALDYRLPWDADQPSDAIPVVLDGLDRWAVGDRMLGDLMAGRDPDFVIGAEWRRGTLPPGRLGWRKAREISSEAMELAAAARLLQQDWTPGALDIDIAVEGARRLTGTITPLWDNRTVTVTYSKLSAKHRLQAWIKLVVLTAAVPDRDWEAYCVGRGGPRDVVQTLGYRSPEQPLSVLRDLVAIYDAGRREPLPLPLKTSMEWARGRQYGDPAPDKGAQREWRWEQDEAEHVEIWGPGAPLAVLLEPPRADEVPVRGEITRLGAYATRLWLPLLDNERRY